MNLYSQYGNDPINYSDPSGLAPEVVRVSEYRDDALRAAAKTRPDLAGLDVNALWAAYYRDASFRADADALVANIERGFRSDRYQIVQDVPYPAPPVYAGPTMSAALTPTTGQVVKQYLKEFHNAVNNNTAAILNLPATVINNEIYDHSTGYRFPVVEDRSKVFQIPMLQSGWGMDYNADPNADAHVATMTKVVGVTESLAPMFLTATPASMLAEEQSAARGLPVLNPDFVPEPKAILQNVVSQQAARLAADPSLAKSVLSDPEYAAGTQSPVVARMQYGNAVERLTARAISSDARLSTIFQRWGGPGQPDFAAIGSTQGGVFDVTTPLGAAKKGGRWYGQMVDSVLYKRPSDFTVFPQ